jgi:hypothetical protein
MFTSSTHAYRAVGRTFRWIVLLPVLLVGSLLYWSVAIGLGGLSLMAASALSVSADATVGVAQITETGGASTATLDIGDGTAPLLIHLEESAEPEDVNDNVGAAGFTPTADDQQAIVSPGPGATSY